MTYHHQIDGQIEVINQTSTTLLRSLVSNCLKDWDPKLPHAEFAEGKARSYATKHSPFESVYKANHLTPIDLLPLLSESRVNHDAELRAER